MEIHFVKLHGNGNDFILVDEYEGTVIPDDMKAEFAEIYCHRRFGIGGDGVLYLSRGKEADLGMRILQPDRSEAEMCGNGIRCLVKHAYDAGYIRKECTVETLAGTIPVKCGYRDDTFYANIRMPDPAFERPRIPATGEGEYREEIGGMTVYAVNTGVPHAVVFVEDLDGIDVQKLAPPIRYHQTFPRGANVNFVAQTGENALRVRTYERGVEGETLSCGTGATAAAAVAHHIGRTGNRVEVETEGGPLTILLGEETWMEGPATTVFSGKITF